MTNKPQNRRPKIPQDIETSLLSKSRRRCCLCFALNQDFTEKKGQIAHLDHNPANNALENLAWLCFNHHDAYDSTTRQSKNYTIGEAKAYRSQLYEVIEQVSQQAVEKYLLELPSIQDRTQNNQQPKQRYITLKGQEVLRVAIINEDEPVAKLLSLITQHTINGSSVNIFNTIGATELASILNQQTFHVIILHDTTTFNRINATPTYLTELTNRTPHALNIVTTAYATNENIQHLYNNNADLIMIKPFDTNTLTEFLQERIQRI